jgi:hypothetical protein
MDPTEAVPMAGEYIASHGPRVRRCYLILGVRDRGLWRVEGEGVWRRLVLTVESEPIERAVEAAASGLVVHGMVRDERPPVWVAIDGASDGA